MKAIILTTLLCVSLGAWAQNENAARIRNFNHENGIAIRDFDPVSYFKGKPVKGTSKFQATHKAMTYYFANAANVEEFKKDPSKYEPAYGGWDAYSFASQGKKEKVDPSTYKIINGKVYLFYNFNGKNNLAAWNKNEKKYKESADARWKKLMD
jgi:YHS domain-containing protein